MLAPKAELRFRLWRVSCEKRGKRKNKATWPPSAIGENPLKRVVPQTPFLNSSILFWRLRLRKRRGDPPGRPDRMTRWNMFANDFTGATGRDAGASRPVAHRNVLKRFQRKTFSKVLFGLSLFSMFSRVFWRGEFIGAGLGVVEFIEEEIGDATGCKAVAIGI